MTLHHPHVAESIDWERFFQPIDPVWRELPRTWDAGPFLGNGMVGAIVRQGSDRELLVEVGRADLEDRRSANNLDASPSPFPYRYAPGAFVLNTLGAITGCDLRLDLWNAELRGTIFTEAGDVGVRCFVPARGPMALIVDVSPSGNEAVNWSWRPYEVVNPRVIRGWSELAPDYVANVSPIVRNCGDDQVSVQRLDHGVAAVAWRVEQGASVGEAREPRAPQRLIAGIAHGAGHRASDLALAAVHDAVDAGNALLVAHRAWWHDWYPTSFVSVSDGYWTAFYWIQLYKLASATRPDGVVLDLQGPWAQRSTAWPATWTNLNLQLTYWPAYVGNRLDLAASLRLGMARHRDNLIANVPPQYRHDSAGIGRVSGLDLAGAVADPTTDADAEIGSLLWLCHNLWWEYRVTMDDTILRDDVYPILRRAVNYHLHFVYKQADGRYHLPSTHSPEYGPAADGNYDLALLAWGCRTLIWINERLRLNDPLEATWRDVDANLVDFPTDEHGYRIGVDQPYARSHRHFSHLFMIWPLRLIDEDEPARALAERSVRWWLSKDHELAGFSYTGGASLLATIGDPDGALALLNEMKPFVRPNTMYHEWENPVIETPLSANQSIHDLLLQSVGDEVRVFTSTPSAWADAVFRDWRGEGGFLVSAERRGGDTRWIAVTSLAGEPLNLRAHFTEDPEISGAERVTQVPGGWDVSLERGATLLVRVPGVEPVVTAIEGAGPPNPFGLP